VAESASFRPTTAPLDLLVVGDANPDLILYGGDIEPLFGQHERVVEHGDLVLGGSGAITAVGAARLGLRTAMAAAVADDVPTGISVALARPDDRAVLTARGALTAFDPADIPDGLLRRTRHVHVASPFLQPGLRDGLDKLVARAHAAGATVSMDTGWDPEERWAPVATVAGAVDVLLPNAQEAVRLAAAASPASRAGRPPAADDPLAAARVLAARGPLVVVKLGANGAVAVHDGTSVRGPAYRVRAVDATGAGDSFDAGFLAGWLGGGDLAYSLALGCACGALSTRRAGGTGGQPTRDEAESLMAAMR
jgi:ribokinase